jgi:hypothetical protein
MIHNSPFYTPQENLEIAVGEIQFKDEVIANLRQQIVALRKSLVHYGMAESLIDKVQYAHQRDKQ